MSSSWHNTWPHFVLDTSKAIYGIIRYLDRYPDRRLATSIMHVEEAPKHSTDWKDFYGRRLRKTQRKYLFCWERRRGSESYRSIHKKQSTVESTNLGADTLSSRGSIPQREFYNVDNTSWTESTSQLLGHTQEEITFIQEDSTFFNDFIYYPNQCTIMDEKISNEMRLSFMNRKRKLTIHGERFV